jgi:hypothetical protein
MPTSPNQPTAAQIAAQLKSDNLKWLEKVVI